MASIEFIKKRIDGKQKEITKLEKKLERIHKAEASGWEINPYYYSESDLRHALRDLDDAKAALAKYEEDLERENEKAASRNVAVILKFLEMWKEMCTDFYHDGLRKFYAEKEMVLKLGRDYGQKKWGTPEYKEALERFENANKAFRAKQVGYFEKWEEVRNGRIYRGQTKIRDGEYEYLIPYCHQDSFENAAARLKKDLDEEANRKYDFIIERTNAIVGKITDASGLEIGAKGDLNGFIIGDRGIAKVQTIGAGGYNIQCFHFRTLINKA